MAASILLSDLAWAAPDGRLLFSDLNFAFGMVKTGLVGRNGVGKTTLLKLITRELAPRSGQVTVSGRLAVLRQTLRPHPGETIAELFGAADALSLLRRVERGEATDDDLNIADWTLESRIGAALARLDLPVPHETLLQTLSGGQQTRARLAALVFADPDFLLLDEPTNNLDRSGRQTVIDLLAEWKSGAIVVSHDRELLDTMEAIVELTTLGATRYGGNWTTYRELKALELAAAERELADARKQIADADRVSQERTERQNRKNAAGRRDGKSGGTPRILLGARKDRAEDTTGGNARLAERQHEQAMKAVAEACERIEVLQPLTVTLPPTGLPIARRVLEVVNATAGYRPDQPIIRNFSLTLTGAERVAVIGPNGSGKTTLLSLVTGKLRPWAGSVEALTPFAFLDQQVSVLDPSASIRENFRRINPRTDEQTCRSALAKFMFRADAALQTVSTLSGGQMLRAGLACVLGVTPPALLILDEPTNYLDIDSIEAVEAGLRAFDGALLVVSHDESFLKAIGITRRINL